jgi:anaerobic magnesium-protoporphyrin IX monomethyl ester cyclase
MRILLVNVPHPSIGSRIPDDHLPPLGLLSVGGPLIDDGHEVRLLDADLEARRNTRFSAARIAERVAADRPDVVMFGHSGSTSAHPVVAQISRAVRLRRPGATIVYGGIFPTYHWREVLDAEPQIDVVVRGEGEETSVRLLRALRDRWDLRQVPGIAFRVAAGPVATPPAAVIADLDRYRIGWELIDFRRYSYWGGLRAVVVQFSRGCPHPCTYCGQRGFWTRWRHRDPLTFAAELARLHREHGVELINFADENPTVDREAWRRFLMALIAENVPLTLVGSTRADDIVRDADLLPLYRRAGWVRFLLGMENTDENTLRLIRKGGSTTKDREAIRLLRENGILSMATWVAGFEEDDDRSFRLGLRQLLSYDPDQIQALYVTPHRWTPYYRVAAGRQLIQKDARRWDYKHQVLSTRHLPPWRVLLWVKFIEAVVQLRPKAIWRTFFQPDARLRHAMRWYARMGRRVWFTELWNFFFRDRRVAKGPSLQEFWGRPQDAEERSMTVQSNVVTSGAVRREAQPTTVEAIRGSR